MIYISGPPGTGKSTLGQEFTYMECWSSDVVMGNDTFDQQSETVANKLRQNLFTVYEGVTVMLGLDRILKEDGNLDDLLYDRRGYLILLTEVHESHHRTRTFNQLVQRYHQAAKRVIPAFRDANGRVLEEYK